MQSRQSKFDSMSVSPDGLIRTVMFELGFNGSNSRSSSNKSYVIGIQHTIHINKTLKINENTSTHSN